MEIRKITRTAMLEYLNDGPEAPSYKVALSKVSEMASQINDLIEPSQELPAWVQDKITIANHNMEAILGFLQAENIEEGLWANIHAKRKRGESPAKRGDEDYPDQKSWNKASQSESELDQEEYEEACSILEGCSFESDGEKYKFCEESPSLSEAKFQGRNVELGKIMQGDVKKFKVYVKNDKGNVVKVNFGQKGVKIKKNNPERRKSFRARHNCENPGPRWKPRYWSCRKW